MAYNPPVREAVLFGADTPYRHGSEHGLGDTWVFGAHEWRTVFPRYSPPPRVGGLMAYDPATRLLLVGGCSVKGQSESVLSDSWAWNGMGWTQLTAAPRPPGPCQGFNSTSTRTKRSVEARRLFQKRSVCGGSGSRAVTLLGRRPDQRRLRLGDRARGPRSRRRRLR
jgi:hypothetical protein